MLSICFRTALDQVIQFVSFHNSYVLLEKITFSLTSVMCVKDLLILSSATSVFVSNLLSHPGMNKFEINKEFNAVPVLKCTWQFWAQSWVLCLTDVQKVFSIYFSN